MFAVALDYEFVLLGGWLSLLWRVVVLDSLFVLGRSDVFLYFSIDFRTEVFLRLVISSYIILLNAFILLLFSLPLTHFFNTILIITCLIFFGFRLCIDFYWFLIDGHYLSNLLGDLLFLRGRQEAVVFDVCNVVMLIFWFGRWSVFPGADGFFEKIDCK